MLLATVHHKHIRLNLQRSQAHIKTVSCIADGFIEFA